jgi:hypothetical protein
MNSYKRANFLQGLKLNFVWRLTWGLEASTS